MQVLEIKNNLVKIAYDVKDNLALSGFVIIEDTNTPYVAQVVNVKADKLTNFAIVKLLFTFNEDGILKNYNGTIPSLKSTVSVLPSKELLDIIPVEKPLVMGQIAQQDVTLKVDRTILDNNLLICSDNVENTNILIEKMNWMMLMLRAKLLFKMFLLKFKNIQELCRKDICHLKRSLMLLINSTEKPKFLN